MYETDRFLVRADPIINDADVAAAVDDDGDDDDDDDVDDDDDERGNPGAGKHRQGAVYDFIYILGSRCACSFLSHLACKGDLAVTRFALRWPARLRA